MLRAMRDEDAPGYVDGTLDPAVREYAHLPEPEYTEAMVRELVLGSIASGLASGELAVLTIADPEQDRFAGSLVLFAPEQDSIEVGFWLHPEFRGKSLAGAALILAGDFARQSGFSALRARTSVNNIASQQILERAGFAMFKREMGVAPSGDEIEMLHYARELEQI